ncbi:PREDICTED: uncharacterized protein LOC104818992 [Tarenaya hassleriana]|uniref:uncharacterized protein LOC104818992 n=1 Tax=Tarenaya hassleriana TaxID=28532 RepID=UPI00053C313D|nr:PREDICTED: uncharacterized protein LOC104818992 [Tarenaya hassleriana]
MAAIKASSLLLLLFTVILLVDEGSGNEPPAPCPSAQRAMNSPPLQPRQGGRRGERVEGRGRKMIGSTAPVCTYNECRGCRYRCSAQQVPVEGNDPFNSPYHYRCLCHRS